MNRLLITVIIATSFISLSAMEEILARQEAKVRQTRAFADALSKRVTLGVWDNQTGDDIILTFPDACVPQTICLKKDSPETRKQNIGKAVTFSKFTGKTNYIALLNIKKGEADKNLNHLSLILEVSQNEYSLSASLLHPIPPGSRNITLPFGFVKNKLQMPQSLVVSATIADEHFERSKIICEYKAE